MKAAEIHDHWRRLFRGQDPRISGINVRYRNITGLSDGSITLSGPISVLCGENGVGKSRVLKMLYSALTSGAGDFIPAGAICGTAVDFIGVNRRVTRKDGSTEIVQVSDALAKSEYSKRTRLFDPTLQIPYLLHLIRNDQNFGDLIEGVEPYTLNPKQLSEISWLVGREYQALSIYEIPDYQDHERTPYFIAKSNEIEYPAEEMGLGELSLLLAYWIFHSIENDSILLLEEPETFIAPRSQRALIDSLAKVCLEKRIFAIITSHSGVIASRVPNQQLNLVSRVGGSVSFLPNPPLKLLVERLSLLPQRHVALLVEDQAANYFLRAIAEAHNSKFLVNFDVMVTGCDSNITEVLKRLPLYPGQKAVIIGVYDGDFFDKLPKELPRPVICLPGKAPPEVVVKGYLQSKDAKTAASILDVPCDMYLAALSGVDGLDLHDWVREICGALALEQAEFFRKTVRNWVTDNADEALGFCQELENAIIS